MLGHSITGGILHFQLQRQVDQCGSVSVVGDLQIIWHD